MAVAARALRSEILGTLTEASAFRRAVRVLLDDPAKSARAHREIEGIAIELSEGRDGRVRARLAIAAGSGEPVEVRVLVEGVARVDRIDLPGSNPWPAESGPQRRPSSSMIERPSEANRAIEPRRVTRTFGRS